MSSEVSESVTQHAEQEGHGEIDDSVQRSTDHTSAGHIASELFRLYWIGVKLLKYTVGNREPVLY